MNRTSDQEKSSVEIFREKIGLPMNTKEYHEEILKILEIDEAEYDKDLLTKRGVFTHYGSSVVYNRLMDVVEVDG